MSKQEKPTGLALLRAPFEKNQILKLPKPTKKQTDDLKADFKIGIRCKECGGWHHKDVVHLDYVGHAALTDRLLDSDPCWNWEPASVNPDGSPKFDQNGGLWIRLSVCGVTRMGYGHADGKSGGDAIKETIGDALRNAAMRFGAALDLWHKGDLHAAPEEETNEQNKPAQKPIETKNMTPRSETIEELGEYVVQFGKKLSGQKLKNIDPTQLESYIFDYLEQGAKKSNTPLTGGALELFNKGSAYLKLFNMDTPETTKAPEVDQSDFMPI